MADADGSMPRLASAFSGASKGSLTSPLASGESPTAFARRSSSTMARHGSTSSKQEEAYFVDLLSYSLERLGKEPELLAAEREQLKRQASESAVRHYRGFIQVAGCLEGVREETAAVGRHLDGLQAALPALAEAATAFAAAAKSNLGRRAQTKRLLKQHGTLLEVLEVPALMEACLRNGAHDDALDLRAHAAKIALLHPDLPLVQGLVRETEAISGEMLAGLLERLRGAIQLPECLRVVGHLRRLAPFSEAQLRQTFLQCREEWLAGAVARLDASHPYDHLKRLTDAHRLQLFDVVMQFRAIFADEEAPGAGGGAGAEAGGAVYSWAEHRIVAYLEALAQAAPRLREGGALASVLEHCMYCGMSLGRVGLDFRGLLPPIFEACALDLFSQAVQAAVESCLVALGSHRWLPPAPGQLRRAAAGGEAAGREGAAPQQLLEHPPLALLANGLLAALNELRHCAPLSLRPRLAAVLQEALLAAARGLAHCRATRALGPEEAPLLQAACDAHAAALCPFASACFQRVFPRALPLQLQAVADLMAPPAEA